MRESVIEAYLVKRVREAGGMCLKWVSPGTVGVPDRIVLMPGRRIAFVELKSPRGHVEAHQQRMMNKLRDLGQIAVVIRDHAGVDLFIGSPAMKGAS